jgi:hypothetical protein
MDFSSFVHDEIDRRESNPELQSIPIVTHRIIRYSSECLISATSARGNSPPIHLVLENNCICDFTAKVTGISVDAARSRDCSVNSLGSKLPNLTYFLFLEKWLIREGNSRGSILFACDVTLFLLHRITLKQ